MCFAAPRGICASWGFCKGASPRSGGRWGQTRHATSDSLRLSDPPSTMRLSVVGDGMSLPYRKQD